MCVSSQITRKNVCVLNRNRTQHHPGIGFKNVYAQRYRKLVVRKVVHRFICDTRPASCETLLVSRHVTASNGTCWMLYSLKYERLAVIEVIHQIQMLVAFIFQNCKVQLMLSNPLKVRNVNKQKSTKMATW